MLQALFLFIAFVFIMAAIVVITFIRKVTSTVNKLKDSLNGGNDSHRKDTIVDTRQQERAKRKIFTDDEGEYVDYEEVE